jgi:hypothetical protein
VSLEIQYRGECPTLFHVTTRANSEKILATGFLDATGDYMTGEEHSGVFLSNYPLDCNDGAWGDTTLAVIFRVSITDLDSYEWVEEGKPYREWSIPASYISQYATVELAPDDADID